jgi:GTP-binding protein YchF
MSLSVGIVGLPNVGKSTLFNALTKKSVPAENYPFCTIDPSVGVVAVPDPRLDTLSKISGSQKTIPAIVEFVDIAGLVKGAADGEGLGNKFLAHIREVDMIAEVVRIFEDENVIHVSGHVDPLDDISVINLELIMADFETVSKRLGNVERDAKRGEKTAVAEKEVLEKVRQHLEAGQLAVTLPLTKEEMPFLKSLHLLSAKPFLYVLNRKSGARNIDDLNDGRWSDLMEFMESTGSHYVVVDAGVEHDLKDLAEDEKMEFRREYGAQDSGIDALIKSAYSRLGLMSYFTTGEVETRAWTVAVGATGPEAGAAIHTDFKEKYIRAQVVAFDDLATTRSLATAREQGKLRTEGKEYIVKDGDVIEFMV